MTTLTAIPGFNAIQGPSTFPPSGDALALQQDDAARRARVQWALADLVQNGGRTTDPAVLYTACTGRPLDSAPVAAGWRQPLALYTALEHAYGEPVLPISVSTERFEPPAVSEIMREVGRLLPDPNLPGRGNVWFAVRPSILSASKPAHVHVEMRYNVAVQDGSERERLLPVASNPLARNGICAAEAFGASGRQLLIGATAIRAYFTAQHTRSRSLESQDILRHVDSVLRDLAK